MLKKLTLLLSLLFVFSITAQASDRNPVAFPHTEMVFVLDASGSMQQNDPQKLALEALNQIIFSSLTDVDIGFVAFNDKVAHTIPVTGTEQRKGITNTILGVRYEGYTNAGDALQTAISLFSSEDIKKKYIVFLSDGEIAMDSADRTAQSVMQFEEAIRQAKNKEITIFTIGMGSELSGTNNSIFDAARASGGKTYYAPTDEDLWNTVNTILWEDLGMRKQSVALVTATGGEDTVKVQIPSENASVVRLLLTSDSSLKNIGVNCVAQDMRVYSGNRYGVIELKAPSKQEIDVRFTGQAGALVSAELVSEYYAYLDYNIEYQDTELENRIARKATIFVQLLNVEKNAENLFEEAFFDGKEVTLTIDGEANTFKVSDGAVSFQQEVFERQTMKCMLELQTQDINMFISNPIEIPLEEAPVMPPKTDYRPLWVTLSVFSLIMIGLLFWYRNKHLKQQKPSPPEPPQSIYDFSGKLYLYITRTPDGSDIPPQTFALYRLFSKKEISLAAILERCGIKQVFRGASMVLFQPGANNSLLLTNKSDCTLLKGRDLVMKMHSYQLFFEDKVCITFEDEVTELTMIYKNVKPSEK